VTDDGDVDRPLTARSVVGSTLLGVRPPRLPVRSLVASGRLFGIAEGAVRTALSRMVAAGEVTVVDGAYELAGALRARSERQDESRRGATRPDDGTWEQLVVVGDRRPAADRAELRTAARALRLAELREGVWLRPANLDPDRLPAARAVVAAQGLALEARPADPVALARRLWDLDGWADRARALADRLDGMGPRLAADPAPLREGFLLLAASLRHLQADPLLPAGLTPPAWPGADLRAAHEAADAAFNATWDRRLRAAAAVPS